MGYDVKAILYYGIRLGEDDPMDGEEENDYHGANEVWAKLNRPKEPAKTNNYLGPQWDNWREEVKKYEQSTAHVEIDWSGHDNAQTYFVHCPCLEKQVEWEDQLDLGRDALLGTNPEADASIKAFCDKFGIEYKKPSWHLAALYL
jgi:hypothetical protein